MIAIYSAPEHESPIHCCEIPGCMVWGCGTFLVMPDWEMPVCDRHFAAAARIIQEHRTVMTDTYDSGARGG